MGNYPIIIKRDLFPFMIPIVILFTFGLCSGYGIFYLEITDNVAKSAMALTALVSIASAILIIATVSKSKIEIWQDKIVEVNLGSRKEIFFKEMSLIKLEWNKRIGQDNSGFYIRFTRKVPLNSQYVNIYNLEGEIVLSSYPDFLTGEDRRMIHEEALRVNPEIALID